MKQALSHDKVTYHLFSTSVMLVIEIIFKMSHISKYRFLPYQHTLNCK